MSKRVRQPLVSLGMFLVLCGTGFVVWEHRHELTYEAGSVTMHANVRRAIEDEIMGTLEKDECFIGMRSNISWRPNEKRYRLDIEMLDGGTCEARARSVCMQIARIIKSRTDKEATVIAFDTAGREMGRAVL
jgi:hypothetical protein